MAQNVLNNCGLSVDANGNLKTSASTPAGTNWVFVAAIILGLICAAYELIQSNPVYIVVGVALILFAALFAGTIWDWICRQKALGGPL